jgi:hypothetical protein
MNVWTVAIEDDGQDLIHSHGPTVVVFSTRWQAEKYCCDYIKEFLVEDFDEDFLGSICEQGDIDLILEHIEQGKYSRALEHFLDVFYDNARVPYLSEQEVR